MKIAMIVRKLNISGGVQRHAMALAREFISRGHDVTFYTFFFSPERCYPELVKSFKVVSLDWKPNTAWVRFGFGLLQEYRAARQLALLIDPRTGVLNPDHATYRVAYYFKKLVRDVPSIWVMHDMPTKRFSQMRAQESPLQSVPYIRRIFSWIADWYDIRRFIRVQNCIAVLDRRDKKLVETFFGKEAIIVRNGIDTSYFPYRKRTPPVSRKTSFLMSGIFLPHRRFEDGIKAAATLRAEGFDVHTVIVGDYNYDKAYYQRLQMLIDSLGMKHAVTFRGRISENDLIQAYHGNDILIFPNHLQSWGLAVFEAMACGMPVIVSKTAGASEVLTHGENALLVNPKAPEEIVKQVKFLVDHPDEYLRLSRNGRKFVEENLSWKKLADQMENIFKELIKRGK